MINMNKTIHFGIEKIIQNYTGICNELFKEREKLGLPNPKNLEVKLMFSEHTHGGADNKETLFINPFSPRINNYSIDDNLMAREIGNFADQIRNLSCEAGYHSDMNNMGLLWGEKSFDFLKPKYGVQTNHFERDKKSFKLEKEKYNGYFLHLINKVNNIKKDKLLYIIGHEIDHLGFNSKFVQNHNKQIEELENKINSNTHPLEYIKLINLSQNLQIKYSINTEISAHFYEYLLRFNYDFSKLKEIKKIVTEDVNDYIEYKFISATTDYLSNKAVFDNKLNISEITEMASGFCGFFENEKISNHLYQKFANKLLKYDSQIIGAIIQKTILKKKELLDYCDKTAEKNCNLYSQKIDKIKISKKEKHNEKNNNTLNETVNKQYFQFSAEKIGNINKQIEGLNNLLYASNDYDSSTNIKHQIEKIKFKASLEFDYKNYILQMQDNNVEDIDLILSQNDAFYDKKTKYVHFIPAIQLICYNNCYEQKFKSKDAEEINEGIQGLFKTEFLPKEKRHLASEKLCKYDSKLIGNIVKECIDKRNEYLVDGKRTIDDIKKEYSPD
jgi:hypothetical protein